MRRKILAVFMTIAVAVSMSAFLMPSDADAAVSASALKEPVMYLNVQSSSSVKVRWNKVNGATDYGIYCSAPSAEEYTSDSVPCNLVKTLSKKKTSYTIKGLKSGKHYAVYVAAGKYKNGSMVETSECEYRDIQVVTTKAEILAVFPYGTASDMDYIPIVVYNQSKYPLVVLKDAEYYPDIVSDEENYVDCYLKTSVTIKAGTKKTVKYYFSTPQTIDSSLGSLFLHYKYHGSDGYAASY
jgi:Fibronectin type III domain.